MEYKPFLVSWNITKRCNLNCPHCYLDASGQSDEPQDELTTEEGFRLIDQISELNSQTFLILTGGEPLLRKDFMDLARYASGKLRVLVGTNGVLLNDKNVKKMVECGVSGVGISMDSINPENHDSFRGMDGAWDKAASGIEACKKHGLNFQIQTTITNDNYDEIPDMIEYSHSAGAKAFTLFFLVCTGRGQKFTDLSPVQYEKMLSYLAKAQEGYLDMMIRARCAPYFMRISYQKEPFSRLASSCYAGKQYCRITPKGDVTPCPYLPTSVGNVRSETFSDIWTNSNLFHQMRHSKVKGKCGVCEFNFVCGGCRARAFASTGDYMAEDPMCLYKPKLKSKEVVKSKDSPLIWTKDAKERIENVPFFVRDMVKKELENRAKEKGLDKITPELMADMKKKWAGRVR